MGGKVCSRRPVLVWTTIVLYIVFILASSVCVYALTSGYWPVYEDEGLEVELRIDRITFRGDDTARVRASVLINNRYEDDIRVESFSVTVWSASLPKLFHGSDEIRNLLIRAGTYKVVRKQVVIQEVDSFLENTLFIVDYSITWTHFGHTYIQEDTKPLDIAKWKAIWPEFG